MFPVIMLILQFLWRRFHLWIDQFTAACHLCHFLKYNCIVHCLMRIFTPGKRSVVFAKDCRNSLIIKLAEITVAAYNAAPAGNAAALFDCGYQNDGAYE